MTGSKWQSVSASRRSTQRTGTLAAQQKHYKEEREKILADQKTIRDAGADGTCPLCRQKLGSHFGSLDAEFTQKLEELTDKAVADLEKQERLGKREDRGRVLKTVCSARSALSQRKLRQKPVYETELAELEAKQDKKNTGSGRQLLKSIAKLAYNDEAYLPASGRPQIVQKVQLRFIELGKKIGQGIMVKKQLADLTSRIRRTEHRAHKSLEGDRSSRIRSRMRSRSGKKPWSQTETALRNEEVIDCECNKGPSTLPEEKIADYQKSRSTDRLPAERGRALIKEEIELLKLTRKLIGEYVIYLMQVVRSRLEGEVSRIISEITGGRYEQVLLDEDFNLLVRDIDNDYPIERFSGGEQDDIAVALRIALSRYLAELHGVHESTFLIFDEIFGSQDEERRNNLLTALRTQESRFPQILLISHIAEMQGEFANTLVVEMGTDMVSRVREVGEMTKSYEESVDQALRRITEHVPDRPCPEVRTGEWDHP